MQASNKRRNSFRNLLRVSCLSALTIQVLASESGCNRAHYRNRADQEVSNLIGEKVQDACAPGVPGVQMDRASRMFDPFNPDRPPMPEDDGVAHGYMKVLNGKKHYPLWDVNGKTNTAENPIWWQYLPLDARGVLVLDADMAVRTAVLHNTNYQSEIETLYLSWEISCLLVTAQPTRPMEPCDGAVEAKADPRSIPGPSPRAHAVSPCNVNSPTGLR
jgi:hypothetical protein